MLSHWHQVRRWQRAIGERVLAIKISDRQHGAEWLFHEGYEYSWESGHGAADGCRVHSGERQTHSVDMALAPELPDETFELTNTSLRSSKYCSQTSIWYPDFAETFMICIPGRTA